MVLQLSTQIAPPFAARIACVLLAWLFMSAAIAQQINAGPYVPSPQSVVADMLKVAGHLAQAQPAQPAAQAAEQDQQHEENHQPAHVA